eukprot:scaffold61759_cov53-Phaeocystis_antarctica.AAC.1
MARAAAARATAAGWATAAAARATDAAARAAVATEMAAVATEMASAARATAAAGWATAAGGCELCCEFPKRLCGGRRASGSGGVVVDAVSGLGVGRRHAEVGQPLAGVDARQRNDRREVLHVLNVLSRTQHLEVLEGAEGHVERELRLCRQLLAHRPEQLQLLALVADAHRQVVRLALLGGRAPAPEPGGTSRRAQQLSEQPVDSGRGIEGSRCGWGGWGGWGGDVSGDGGGDVSGDGRSTEGGESGGSDDERGGSGVGAGLLEAAH